MKRLFIATALLVFSVSASAEVHQDDPFKPAAEQDVLLISGGESCFAEACPKEAWADHLDYYVFDHEGVKTVALYQHQTWKNRELVDKQVHQLDGEQDAKGTFEFTMNRGDRFVFVIEATDMTGTVTVKQKTLRAPK